jgi:hypothetical protein
MESLERRDLLSVVLSSSPPESFKPLFDFNGSGIVLSGTFPWQGHAIPFSGSAATGTTGSGDYSGSRTQGTFALNSIQGKGNWNAFNVDWGTFTFSSTDTVGGTDNNGSVVAGSGTGNFTVTIVSTKLNKTYYNGPLDFTIGGSFNAAQEKFNLHGVGPTTEPVSLNISGGFTVTTPDPTSDPFSIAVSTATWTKPTDGITSPALQVNVTSTGPVHRASSYTAAVGNVYLYWADANGTKVSPKALSLNIGVDWDEASGTYNITGLPAPPATASQILLVPTYNGTTGTPLAVPLPTQPVLGIQCLSSPVTRLQSKTVPAPFAVTLSEASPFPVTVKYSTANGTATSAADYTAASGTLTFKPGVISLPVTVAVKPNAKAVPNEVFYVKLASPTGAALDPNDTQAACTVEPLAGEPVLAIQGPGPSSPVIRPQSKTVPAGFTVTLSAAATYAVTVKYSTVNDTAKAPADFTAVSGTLTFKHGVISLPVTVAVKANASATAAEDFYVKLSNPTWALLDSNDTQAACTVEPFGFTAPVLQSLASYSAAPQQGKGEASLLPAAIDAILAETPSGQLS